MSLATAVCHTPVSVHWFLCVPVSELWWAPAMPRAAAGTGLPKGRCWCPGPCAWLDIRCAAVLSTWSLFPASSPLCLHSGSVVWHPWGGVIVKQRRKRKRGEAQPAQSLPQNLLAHLRGWVVLGKGTSITSLSYFLGCSSYECIEVLCENFPEYVKFFLKKKLGGYAFTHKKCSAFWGCVVIQRWSWLPTAESLCDSQRVLWEIS